MHRGLILLGLAFVLNGAVTLEPPPLVEAAKARDWSGLEGLLEKGADPNAVAPDGATALHWASYWDEVGAASAILEAGADVNAANDLGATALFNASLNGSVQMVQTLLDAGANPNVALLAGETPVMTGARTGAPEVVRLLLAAGGDPNARGTRGQTALMWAASQGHPEALRVLLEGGAEVSARSDSWTQRMAIPPHSSPANQQDVPHGNNTALLFAARVGDLASAKVLVEAGASVDDADAWGISATTLAAHSGFSDLVEFFLEEGADPSAADAGFAPLHMAIMRRDVDLVQTLLTHGADPNVRVQNWSPTRRASRDWHFHPSLVGATPFWMAARFTQPEVMRILVDHGADPLFVHESSYVASSGTFGAGGFNEATTALMAAVGMGGPRRMRAYMNPDGNQLESLTLETVKLTVDLGVDVGAVDLQGRTAIQMVRYASVEDFLAEQGGR
tara:strand:- start:40824 stop:42167 length:1344 start_codon:yes stop_codon:yes gene_type:complete